MPFTGFLAGLIRQVAVGTLWDLSRLEKSHFAESIIMNRKPKTVSLGILLSLSCLISINGSFGEDNPQQASPPTVSDPASKPPTSGKVITSPMQKEQAATEAVKIKDHDGSAPEVPTKAEVKRPTVAIALGGGGARGAAHIGVLKVLKENNIPVDYIVGNSMGSIVGGLYSAGVPLDQIETMLEDGSLRKSYTPFFIPPKILISPIEKLGHPFGSKNPYAGLFSGKTFQKYLSSKLPKPDMSVNETKIPFSAVATNLVDGQAYRISDGTTLATAIHASSAISPLLKPVPIGDKVYVDGGVRANLPASSARETGADIVIAVLVDEPLQKICEEIQASRRYRWTFG